MATKEKNKIDCYIRWMIRRDMESVLNVEQLSFEFPWAEEDFVRCLRQRECTGMVAEYNDEVIGHMVYELHKTSIHLLNFAVHPAFRNRGVGLTMVEKLTSKLSAETGRNRIMLEVRETNVDAQLFFKRHGFFAIAVLRDFYEDTSEDAYLMQYKLNADGWL